MNVSARHSIPSLVVILLFITVTLAEEPTALVCPCETTEATQLTWGTALTDKKVELNADAAFVSEGKASIHLSGATQRVKGNKYLGVKVPIPKTDMDGRIITFDAWSTTPKNTQAVYLRLYDAAGKTAGSWCNWSSPFKDSPKRTFHLSPIAARDGFSYEPKDVTGKPLTDIMAVEIVIGTPLDDAPFDVYVDNLRMGTEKIKTFADVATAKKLYLTTEIVRDGKPCAVIVAPSKPGYLEIAKKIADRIKALTGTEVPIKLEDGVSCTDVATANTILIGSVCDNRIILPLYGLRYTWVDDAYPGGDGYVVRTVHDPWGTGKNAIILGGGTEAGVAKAVEEFLAMLKEGKDIILGRLHHVVPGDEEVERIQGKKLDEKYIEQRMDLARRALATGAHCGITGHVSDAGLAYGRTGDEIYAELFKKLVYLMYEHRMSDPKTYGGPWGMDADFRLHQIIPAWDLVEESPVFSDEDRFKITKILFEFTDYCMPKARSCLTSASVRHNHQTFPALGLFHAGTYFEKYYGIVEAQYWLEIAEAAFAHQAKSAKPYEDCNGYQWLTLYHLMEYALAKPDWTYFENGNARRDADYAILCMDNLGYQVPYGDTGSYQCWWSEVPFLFGANWCYKDGRYQWTIDKKLGVRKQFTPGQYVRKVSPVEPVDLLGVKAFPVDPMYYETWNGAQYLPRDKTVDKVVMRASFDPGRQYLLLDGLSNGGHKHYDGNSISRITDRGRIWLADNDYIKALPKYHNGVLIHKDGQSETIPPFCELESIVEFDDIGFSETVVRNYAGVDWHRNIIWQKEKYSLVIDEMAAQEANAYTFNCKWHLVGKPTLTGDSLLLTQEGKSYFVKTLPGLQLKLSDDHELGKNWNGYEFAEPVVRVLEQIARARLDKGAQFTYFNLLHSSDDESPLDFKVARAGETSVLITGSGGLVIAGVTKPETATKIGEIEVIASSYQIGREGFTLANAAMLSCGQKMLFQSYNPVSLRCANGKTILIAPQKTVIEIALGKQALKRMTVEPGRAVIEGCPDLTGIAEQIDSIAKSSPVAASTGPAVATQQTLSPMKQIWKYQEEIAEVLLTGNRRHPRAWGNQATITCNPPPLPTNVFSGKAGNKVENLLDGKLEGTEDCTMWEADQPVTLHVDLKVECDISRISLHAWWSNSSSKNKVYQLDTAPIQASSDGFANDIRELGKIVDKADHENWGGTKHLPEVYELKDPKATASQVRFLLTPRKGAGIYVAEIEVWGKPKGVVLSPDLLAAKGIAFTKLTSVCAADLTGDKRDEVILGTTKGDVVCLDPDGKRLWQTKAEEGVTCICVADFKGDGKKHVIAGSEDEKVYAIDPSGKIVWTFEVPRYKKKGCVRTVFPVHLNGGKAEQVMAGADNWHYYAIDEIGKEIWRYESVHDSTVGLAVDTDNDGKDEVICGTVYYWWPCVNPDGTRKWAYSTHTGPIVNAVAAANIIADAGKEVIFGGADANLHVIGSDGKLLWQFNTADAVTAVETLDIDADGKDEIIASSMSFSVYAIKGDGKRVWRQELPEVVTDLALLDSGDGKKVIAASCADGKVYVISPEGKPVAAFHAGSPVDTITPADVDGKGRRSIIALCEDGSARAISP